MNKKIAVFSDVHGNYQALCAIMDDIRKKNIDNIICLGDVIAIGPNPKECLDVIINNNIRMVLGNHEIYYLKGIEIDDEMSEIVKIHHQWIKRQLSATHLDFLSNCPLSITDNLGDYKVVYQHFLLNSDLDDQYPFDELSIIKDGTIKDKVAKLDADIIMVGHEHNAFEIEVNNKKLIDVGSCGCRADDTTFYTILSMNDNSVNIEKVYLKYDRKEFERILKNVDYPLKNHDKKMIYGIE